jgi:ABC-type multidrug transport system fused ATPase/permease subunit
MDGGRLVQSGNHKDLLKDESGIYAELYRLQNEEYWQDTQ